MKATSTSKQTTKRLTPGKQLSYNEIIEFLDTHWQKESNNTTLSCIKMLDKSFGSLSQKLHTILISGSNGKSLTTHFATKILQNEHLSVGTFVNPHILTYNERLSLNGMTITNKAFTEIANTVLNAGDDLNITPSSRDVLTMMAFIYFDREKTDVVLLEAGKPGDLHPVTICSPKVAAITRVTTENGAPQADLETIRKSLAIVKKDTHTICADQSKLNLQTMQKITQEIGGIWAMPIRKLAPLSYPFEQLHGRCAALAERVAYIYINDVLQQNPETTASSLLTKRKGQRGRPTLEAKRQSELNPQKTIEQFWKETLSTLPGRFQLLDKEKPTILLDNASNLDAFKNLLLGIRLLHYQRPLKGLTIILGCNNEDLDVTEFLKLLRYFFKKTSGQVIVCPVQTTPGDSGTISWNVENITNDIKSMKIKARSAKNFAEAFETASNTVDERNGLVVLTGCSSIMSEYWRYKGMKKL